MPRAAIVVSGSPEEVRFHTERYKADSRLEHSRIPWFEDNSFQIIRNERLLRKQAILDQIRTCDPQFHKELWFKFRCL